MTVSIEIKNFKCIEEVSIDLKALTIFTGYNGAGKSTVIQSLLLLSQTFRLAPNGESVDLDGALFHLGNSTDVVRFGEGPQIVFALSEGETRAAWQLIGERRARHLRVESASFEPNRLGPADIVRTVSPPSDHPASALCSRVRDLTFLGASRLFSTTTWPSPPIDIPFGDVGKAGEFAPYWHFLLGDEEVPPKRRRPGDERTTVRGQVDAYLNDLFPGAYANTDQLKDVDLIRLDLRLGADWVRPGNIGFGLTYVFPLLVALVTAAEGQMVIVDSPEAHLHPRAQSELGRIAARFASAGVRVLVETHSDHFLNGVRIAAQNSALKASDAAIYFFSGASSTGHGVQSLHLDANGEIDFWPKGFFDQAETDFSRLLGFDGR